MRLSIEMELDRSGVAMVSKKVAGSEDQVYVRYVRRTEGLRRRWRAALRVEPPDASNYYKLKWRSRKQQKAYYASNGFGAGIPTVRSHVLSTAWTSLFAKIPHGGSYRMFNETEYGSYVYGDFDLPRMEMFVQIPWIDPFEVSEPFMKEAEYDLEMVVATIME